MSDESTLSRDNYDLMEFFKARDWSPPRAAETMAFCIYVIAQAQPASPKFIPSAQEHRRICGWLIKALAGLGCRELLADVEAES